MRSLPLLLALLIASSAHTQPLVNSGGSVLVSPSVVVVLWGETVGPSLPAEVQTFYEMAPSLGHWTWLSQYDTPTQQIGHANYVGTFQIAPQTTTTKLSSHAIVRELRAQIDAGVLPATSMDTYYALYVPPEIDIYDGEGGILCKGYSASAFHDEIGRGSPSGTFGIFPTCAWNASIAFHELFEAVTDPHLDAWTTETGEIADLCEGYGTSLPLPDAGTMNLQELWSNRLNSCAASDDEFRIALKPNIAQAAPTVVFELAALGPGVTPDQVSWTVDGIGDGSSYEIIPPDGGSGGTLTVHLVPPYPWIFFVQAIAGRWTASAAPRLLEPVPDAGSTPPLSPLIGTPRTTDAGCAQTGEASASAPLLALLALLAFARRGS